MSVKKYLGFAAAGVLSLVGTSALAGGPDVMATPAPVDYSGFYIDAAAGWGQSNWADFIGGVFSPTGNLILAGGVIVTLGTVDKNGHSGFTYGGDIGWQFNRYYSVEVGAYDLASVSGQLGGVMLTTGTQTQQGAVKVRSWVLYTAGKIAMPLSHHLDMFVKAGIAWRFLDYSGPGTTVAAPGAGISIPPTSDLYGSPVHYATWVFGTGFQYWITHRWSVTVQYLHFPGFLYTSEINQQSPNVNLVLGGAGYKFAS